MKLFENLAELLLFFQNGFFIQFTISLMNLSHHVKSFEMFISSEKYVQLGTVCKYSIGTCSRAMRFAVHLKPPI